MSSATNKSATNKSAHKNAAVESDSESDWSSTTSESESVGPEPGATVQVEYKGTTWSGTVAKTASAVPTDVVPLVVTGADGSAPVQAVWCRIADEAVTAVSRGECRKLLSDIVGKTAKTDAPSAADIAACQRIFGTVYPVQVVGVDGAAAKDADIPIPSEEALSGDAQPVVSFRVGKQVYKGVEVPFASGVRADGVIAVAINDAPATSTSVYWLTTDVNGKRMPVTVTESRKLMRLLLARNFSHDGPTDADVADCIAACGVSCPAQLFDAKNRNIKAKQRRGGGGAAAAAAAGGGGGGGGGGGAPAGGASVVKRPRPVGSESASKKAKAVAAAPASSSGPVTVSFTGTVDDLMPIMTAYKQFAVCGASK
tara:strand:+ start:26949 stop:28055 length:1107 start_codon:yes stop_codon:yes gene_type:complete